MFNIDRKFANYRDSFSCNLKPHLDQHITLYSYRETVNSGLESMSEFVHLEIFRSATKLITGRSFDLNFLSEGFPKVFRFGSPHCKYHPLSRSQRPWINHLAFDVHCFQCYEYRNERRVVLVIE